MESILTKKRVCTYDDGSYMLEFIYKPNINSSDYACIRGDIEDNMLYIADMDSYPPKKGLGAEMLKILNGEYSSIIVYSSSHDASPFWKKMIERNIVKDVIKKRGVLLVD